MRATRYIILITLVSGAALGSEWLIARPDYDWSFPEDHWAHAGYKTEWWYFTGHLESEEGDRFGYQFTFFKVGLTPSSLEWNSTWSTSNLIMGHASVSDLSTGRHVFTEVIYRAVPMLGGFGTFPDTTIVWSRAPTGTDDTWRLAWNGSAFDFSARDDTKKVAFSLRTVPAKPLVFQGPAGYSRKGAGESSASLYYSFTRLTTSGRVRLGDRVYQVSGESWMDKEFGSNQLSDRQVGWDWFSLQLGDGRELMLYQLRDSSGEVDYANGTLIGEDGSVDYLTVADLNVHVLGRWTSDTTGATYPAGWTIEVPAAGLRLIVEPELADQENGSELVPGLHYWEGAVTAIDENGSPAGRGYVELVGYGTQKMLGI